MKIKDLKDVIKDLPDEMDVHFTSDNDIAQEIAFSSEGKTANGDILMLISKRAACMLMEVELKKKGGKEKFAEVFLKHIGKDIDDDLN